MPAVARVLLPEVLIHVIIVLQGVRIEASLQGVKHPILQGFLCEEHTTVNTCSDAVGLLLPHLGVLLGWGNVGPCGLDAVEFAGMHEY